MLRAQVGDRQAIAALLRSVQPMLARFVRAVVGAADAEDVTQDVMVLIYRKLWTLTAPDLFRPWAYRIASRAAFRHLRSRRRWPDHLRDDEALDDLPAQDLPVGNSRVDELLQDPRVTPASRAVLALHFKEEMTLRGYSYLSATSGSTRIARRDGSQLAPRAMTRKNMDAPTNDTRSIALSP